MKTKTMIIIILIIALSFVPLSYAFENIKENSEEEKFFTVDSNKKEIGATLNMYVDLDKIEQEEFKFALETTSTLLNISAKTDNEKDIEILKNEKGYYFNVDKEELEAEKITLTYIVQNTFKANDIIKLKGIVYDLEEKEISKNEIEVTIAGNQEQEKEEEQEDKSKENIMPSNNEMMQNQVTIQNQGTMVNIQNSDLSSNNKSTVTANTTSSVTYKGSDNNYLSELSVTGYELNTTFNKVNTTYFISVSQDITELEINATTEDSSSEIKIYGNDNLVSGNNKVLVTVTAENGNSRTYRIFVTKE